jgi:MFS family permease
VTGPRLKATTSHGLESSPWAPLRNRIFAWLWVGVLVSGMGTWMQTLGAQWLLVQTPNAALVSLVQTANSLPVMLLAMPAGVIADAFDRRWLLFGVQVWSLVIGIALLVLTLLDFMPPGLLLVFTLLLGLGAALQLPAWQASTPELVPRDQIRSAARLEMVGVNLSRAIGPAVGGAVIAGHGVPAVFGLNAISVFPLAIALLFWRQAPTPRIGSREPFWSALRAGGRYMWHDTSVRRILIRLAVFILPMAAMWGLLPLVASQRLDVGAGGYGILFAALGAGAILGALVLGRVRRILSTNGSLTVAGLLLALALASLVLVSNFWLVLVVLVVAGLGWTSTISTLIAELQLFLPRWVMARGMAIYTMVFTGSQAIGALLWGIVAQHTNLTLTFLVAAGLEVIAVVIGALWRVPDAPDVSPDPVTYWSEARVSTPPEPTSGPVMVTVSYTIAPDRHTDWLAAMQQLRRSRLRTGATRWELYRDADDPTRFVEQFRVSTWEEHLRQHDGRLTEADRSIETHALSFSNPAATAEHLIPPDQGHSR